MVASLADAVSAMKVAAVAIEAASGVAEADADYADGPATAAALFGSEVPPSDEILPEVAADVAAGEEREELRLRAIAEAGGIIPLVKLTETGTASAKEKAASALCVRL